MTTLFITPRLCIPIEELEWEYVRSSGPGGQNVNKTNSCAVARWNYIRSESLKKFKPSESEIEKLLALATNDGDIMVRSQTFRDQERNYQECLDKLREILKKVFFKPKKRIATKPTKSSQRRRLDSKKRNSEKKSLRQRLDK